MNIQRTIVAIGGGEIRNGETLAIDSEIVRLSGRMRPRVLFVPTASNDAESYAETFRGVYESQLGCIVDVLWLWERLRSLRDVAEQIDAAHVVYVGGGNTLRMMRRWRHLGVDALLRAAWKRGVIMSGISAGAICWFRYGTSDSRRFYDPNDESLIRVRGLGLVDAIVSPHHLAEPNRRAGLISVMQRSSGVGLAIDDNAALILRGREYQVVRSRARSGIHKAYRVGGEVVYRRLGPDEQTGSLDTLLARR